MTESMAFFLAVEWPWATASCKVFLLGRLSLMDKQTPIVFIGHSMGGLVIKKVTLSNW